MRHYIRLTKEIDLRAPSDRRDLLELLKSIREFNTQLVQIENIIKLFVRYLSDEWLKFYRFPVDGVVLEIEDHKTVAFNFVDDIIPLGLSLLELQRLRKFQNLIDKLNTRAHDRLSAVMETIFSSKYKQAGYSVYLEPTTIFDKCPDFKVKINGEWIFFECKAENYFESESFSRNNRDFKKNAGKIKRELSGFSNLAIELKSNRRLSDNDLELLIHRIKDEFQRNSFGNRIDCYGIELIISQVPSSSNTDIQISQSVYFGTIKDRKRIGNLINSARDQIPVHNRGVIIIKTHNKDLASSIARKNILRENYRHISAIIVIESGEGEIIPNEHAEALPLDFLRVAMSQPLPSYWY